MSLSYKPLWVTLAEKGLKKTYLITAAEISGSTLAKMGKSEYISLDVLERICSALDVPVEKVIKFEK